MPLRTRMGKKSNESTQAVAAVDFSSDDDSDRRALRPSTFSTRPGRGRALLYVAAAVLLCASIFALSSRRTETRTTFGYVGDYGSEDNFVDHATAAVVDSLSRPFRWDGDPYDWCAPEPQQYDDNLNSTAASAAPSSSSATSSTSTTAGLFFVKIMKAASSTGAGITLRIAVNAYHRMKARHMPDRPEEEEEEEEEYFTVGPRGCTGCCRARYWHEKAHSSHYDRRDRKRSFLWSIVREPARRAVSHVYFKRVSREGMVASDENLIGELRREKMRDFQVRYLETTTSTSSSSPQEGQNGAEDGSAGRDSATAESSVRDILRDYDFLAVAERMDESLVVLKMMLRLDFGDFLYLSSKVTSGGDGGSYDDGRSDRGCIKLEKARVSEGVASFLSGEFQTLNRRDLLLYSAVNRSLDLTIERLGRTKFEAQLIRYRTFLDTVRNICEGAAIFPCSSEGVLRRNESDANCYFNDWGCGYPCIDKFIVDYAAGRYSKNENNGDVT